jgi:hypothetical protein
MTIQINLPPPFSSFRLPKGVEARLHALLDKQDSGTPLTRAERREAEGLVDIVQLLSMMRLRSEVVKKKSRQ